jgi:hypothetical protein
MARAPARRHFRIKKFRSSLTTTLSVRKNLSNIYADWVSAGPSMGEIQPPPEFICSFSFNLQIHMLPVSLIKCVWGSASYFLK